LPGVQPTALLDLDGVRLGVIGVTAEFPEYVRVYGLQMPPALEVIREHVMALRRAGADAVVLLSHLGLPADRMIAAALPEELALIIGAHTHDRLPEGEWVGSVCIVQAGAYAEHLGRVDLRWDGTQLTVQHVQLLRVGPEILPDRAVLATAAAAEAEITRMLDTIIGDLPLALDFALDRDCGVGQLTADMLRTRMQADVGVVVVGAAFTGPLPAGPLRRLTLYDVCETTSGPAVVTLTGAQLTALVGRGRSLEFAQARPRALRGLQNGLLHLSGASWVDDHVQIAGQPIDLARTYRVAGTDWEFEPYGGCADRAWGLSPTYELQILLREAIEAYLAAPGTGLNPF
jgi:2',3'-cyclic-nucleotide 2'-phosphodiesterase (5'-nucleotidase family)